MSGGIRRRVSEVLANCRRLLPARGAGAVTKTSPCAPLGQDRKPRGCTTQLQRPRPLSLSDRGRAGQTLSGTFDLAAPPCDLAAYAQQLGFPEPFLVRLHEVLGCVVNRLDGRSCRAARMLFGRTQLAGRVSCRTDEPVAEIVPNTQPICPGRSKSFWVSTFLGSISIASLSLRPPRQIRTPAKACVLK